MSRGKSIWALAITFLFAWLGQPIWEWGLDRFLDYAVQGKGGVTGALARVFTATAPAHGLLLGLSLGMMLAFAIGYWDQIASRLRYWAEWCRAIIWLLWNARPGMRRVSYGLSILRAGEAGRHIESSFPVHPDTVKLEWWPKDKVYLRQANPGVLFVMRTDPSSAEDLRIAYEVWGRRDVGATLKNWRKMNFIQLQLDFRKMQKESGGLPEPLPLYEP